MKKKVIAIVLLFIILLTLIIATKYLSTESPATYGPRKTASGTLQASLNGESLNWYDSSKKASENAENLILSGENSLVFDLADNKIKNVSLTTSLPNNSTTEENDFLGNIIDGAVDKIKDFVVVSGVKDNGNNSFTINANAFKNGEIVVIMAVFSEEQTELDKTFGKGIYEGYFAFIASSDNSSNTDPVNDESNDSSEELDSDFEPSDSSNNDEGSNWLDNFINKSKEVKVPSEITDGVKNTIDQISNSFSESDDSSETSEETDEENSEDTEESSEDVADTSSETTYKDEVASSPKSIMFNGFEQNSFVSRDAALEHPIVISKHASRKSTISCIVDEENTARVRVCIENSHGSNQYDEYILYNDNNWSDVLRLRKYSGQTIILALSASDKSMIPNSVYSYIAVEVPE